MAINILDHFIDKKYDLFISGLPRNISLNSEKFNPDDYRTDDEIEFVREITKNNNKILGYFPTWREDGIELFRDIKSLKELDQLNEVLKINGFFFILIKKHMNSEKRCSQIL